MAKLYGLDVETILIDGGFVIKQDIHKVIKRVEMKPTIEDRLDVLENRVKQLEKHDFPNVVFGG